MGTTFTSASPGDPPPRRRRKDRRHGRRGFTAVLSAGLLGLTMIVPASAHHGDPNDPLTLHESHQDAIGKTAAEVVELGIVSNDPDGCGEIDLEAGEVGWAFLTPGNHRSNKFTHFIATFDDDGTEYTQEWAFDNDPGDATRVRVQGGNTTLVAFKSGFNDTLKAADAWGIQSDDRFNLTHVCVGEEPEEGSVLVRKDYSVDPGEDNHAEFELDGEPMERFPQDGFDLYCTDELLFGDYTVTESVVPVGFDIDDFDGTVTVDEESTCAERLAAYTAGDEDLQVDNDAAPVPVVVTKWKLTLNEAGELVRSTTPLAGFEYTITRLSDDTVVATGTTAPGTGQTDFGGVELDVDESYSICETGRAAPADYWTEADPLCQTVTPELGDTLITVDFENEPLSRVEIDFFNMTGFTSATIDCDFDGLLSSSTDAEGNISFTADQIPLGDYECTFEIRNGGDTD